MRKKEVERWDQFVDVIEQIKKKEKSDRLKQVMEHPNTLHSLCEVLGVDFKQTVNEVHPSLGEADGSKNLSNCTIESLASAASRLRELKVKRMQKLQDLPLACLNFGISWIHHLKNSICSRM
uniref:65-kDa microtubule-associated protein 3 n=1 Tax=Zea mays TaxID=4577 RepID=A0A804N462_MAIZE